MKSFFLLFFIFHVETLMAESISIPLNSIGKPASDLIYINSLLDPGDASALAAQGLDLSLLNPSESRLWQNKNYDVSDNQYDFPNGNDGISFISYEATLRFTSFFKVSSKTHPNQFYRLSISQFSHSALMRTALLRKLGYYLPTPQFYNNLKIFFINEEEKNKFITNVSKDIVVADLTKDGWILNDNKNDHSLVLADALLEPIVDTTSDYFDLSWGQASNPKIPGQMPFVRLFSQYRPYRSLIVPYKLATIPESVNQYRPDFGSILSGHLVIYYPTAESFAACNYDDAKWIVRRLHALQPKDFYDIVEAGHFHPSLRALIYAKFLYQINNAFEFFNLPTLPVALMPDLNLTTPDGIVIKGRVVQKNIPGYPQNVSYKDPESPIKDGDIWRYFDITGRATLLGAAVNALNEKLQVSTTADLFARRQEELRQKIIDHIKNHPDQILYQPVEPWSGIIAGVNVSANRLVTTGTYFESAAPIQLVDQFSISTNLGYFRTLDGVTNYTPVQTANAVFTRDFIHVTPLMLMEDGRKMSWKNVFIPNFMENLAAILDNKNINSDKALNQFLDQLKENEVFTITDSVALSIGAQAMSTLDNLMGITPLNFINSVSGGIDANKVILSQTSLFKTNKGLQILVRTQNSEIYGLTVNANYFINLLKIRANHTNEKTHTDAFLLDHAPGSSLIPAPTNNSNNAENIQAALIPIFRGESPAILYEKFRYHQYKLDHDIINTETKTKFLLWKTASFDEDHTVHILHPEIAPAADNTDKAPALADDSTGTSLEPTADPLDPKKEEVVLFSNKRGYLEGFDPFGLVRDLIQGWINKKAPKSRIDLSNIDSTNPANLPYGSARWKIINSEGDLSPERQQHPSVSLIQTVWGGWHLSGDKFKKIIKEISNKYKIRDQSYRTISNEYFSTTTQIDFYRITASLSILQEGLDLIQNFILQKPFSHIKTNKARWWGRPFQVISEAIGKKRTQSDVELYNALLKIKNLKTECSFDTENTHTPRGGWLNGNYFDCLPPWVTQLIKLSHTFPSDKKEQIRWNTQVLSLMESHLGTSEIMNFLGEKNYIFVVRINGFRKGDEFGDIEYFSNSYGDPSSNIDYANGLINMYVGKTGIVSFEVDRSLGSFK